jgi:hypothetical protein
MGVCSLIAITEDIAIGKHRINDYNRMAAYAAVFALLDQALV